MSTRVERLLRPHIQAALDGLRPLFEAEATEQWPQFDALTSTYFAGKVNNWTNEERQAVDNVLAQWEDELCDKP